MKQNNYDDILTVSDLQRFLKISRSTAYRLVKDKKIRHIRICNNIRIPKRAIAEYIEQYSIPVVDNNKSCYNSDRELVVQSSLSEKGVNNDR